MSSQYRILWLEDEKHSIADLSEYLQAQGNFSVKILEKSYDALEALLEDTPDLFIIDLLLSERGSDGLSIAKTARAMKPSMPIIAVTAYVARFSRDIALSLVNRTYPFDAIYQKSQLESLESRSAFVVELRLLCQPST